MMKIIYYFQFFKHAAAGLYYTVTNHRSFMIQVLTALLVMGAGTFLRINRMEWILILFVMFSVLVAELLNTSIETTLDYMEKQHNLSVKIAKDISAGAVFLMSCGAVVIGLIVFWPYVV